MLEIFIDFFIRLNELAYIIVNTLFVGTIPNQMLILQIPRISINISNKTVLCMFLFKKCELLCALIISLLCKLSGVIYMRIFKLKTETV